MSQKFRVMQGFGHNLPIM